MATKEVLNSLISPQSSRNFSCIHMSSMSDMKRVHAVTLPFPFTIVGYGTYGMQYVF